MGSAGYDTPSTMTVPVTISLMSVTDSNASRTVFQRRELSLNMSHLAPGAEARWEANHRLAVFEVSVVGAVVVVAVLVAVVATPIAVPVVASVEVAGPVIAVAVAVGSDQVGRRDVVVGTRPGLEVGMQLIGRRD